MRYGFFRCSLFDDSFDVGAVCLTPDHTQPPLRHKLSKKLSSYQLRSFGIRSVRQKVNTPLFRGLTGVNAASLGLKTFVCGGGKSNFAPVGHGEKKQF